MKRRSGRIVTVGLAMLLAIAGGVKGQTEAGIQFNLSTPGARSLGMGGAFIGLADDATAAYTNPAGLTNLVVGGPEIALELRSFSYASLYIRGGRFDCCNDGVGIDTVEGLHSGVSRTQENGLSFLSVAYTFPGGLTAAAYAHRSLDFSKKFSSQGVFSEDETSIGRSYPIRQSLAAQIFNYGLSAAYEWQDVLDRKRGDSLSLGLGLSYYSLDLTQSTFSFDIQDLQYADSIDRLPGFFYGPADFLGDNLRSGEFIDDKATDIGVNLGVLWKSGSRKQWSLGVVYRQGPDFTLDVLSIDISGRTANGRVPLHAPDVLGMGIAYSLAEGRTKIALDYDEIKYSKRFDDLVPKNHPARDDFRLADAAEIHLGVEHVFLTTESHFVGTVRLGGWYEPNHELEYLGADSNLRALIPRQGKDYIHYSAGLGLVVKEDFQIDAAIDLSDRVNTASVSIVRFF